MKEEQLTQYLIPAVSKKIEILNFFHWFWVALRSTEPYQKISKYFIELIFHNLHFFPEATSGC